MKNFLACILLFYIFLSPDSTFAQQISANHADPQDPNIDLIICVASLPNCGYCQVSTMMNVIGLIWWKNCKQDYSGCIRYNTYHECQQYGFGLDSITGQGILNCLVYNQDGTCQTCYVGFTLDQTSSICIAGNCTLTQQDNGACNFDSLVSQCSEGYKRNGYGCIPNDVQANRNCSIVNTNKLYDADGSILANPYCQYCYNGYLICNIGDKTENGTLKEEEL